MGGDPADARQLLRGCGIAWNPLREILPRKARYDRTPEFI
jgi:hypothetical protein